MKILENYLARAVVYGIAIASSVLMTIFIFIYFIGELRYVTEQYTTWKALQYSVLTNLTMLRNLFPMTALLGCLMGLGALAGNNELTVMRAAGVSVKRIVWAVMKVGLVMMILLALFNEYVAPISGQYGEYIRSTALKKKTVFGSNKYGVWVRDGSDIIHARHIDSNHHLRQINVFTLDQNNRLISQLYASEAVFDGKEWIMRGVKQTVFEVDKIRVITHAQMPMNFTIEPDIVDVVTVEPIDLSIFELNKLIQHLRQNDQNSHRHEVAFWSKIFSPFSTGIMIYLAVPFVFGSLRSVNLGSRLLTGTLIGLGFYLFNEGAIRFGMVYEMSPLLSASAPTLAIFLYALILSRRLR